MVDFVCLLAGWRPDNSACPSERHQLAVDGTFQFSDRDLADCWKWLVGLSDLVQWPRIARGGLVMFACLFAFTLGVPAPLGEFTGLAGGTCLWCWGLICHRAGASAITS